MDKKKATAVVQQEDEPSVVQAEDGGHIELVLRCLASMCDGQNTVLQVYNNITSAFHLEYKVLLLCTTIATVFAIHVYIVICAKTSAIYIL